jgi:hypothetical protein
MGYGQTLANENPHKSFPTHRNPLIKKNSKPSSLPLDHQQVTQTRMKGIGFD